MCMQDLVGRIGNIVVTFPDCGRIAVFPMSVQTLTPPPPLLLDSPRPPIVTGPVLRAARRDEIERVLDLRSEAFGLPTQTWDDLRRASEEILDRTRVVVAEGRIVSTLSIRAESVQIGSATLPMGGICNVATLPSERNHGYASLLMRDSLRVLAREGLCTSILFPFSFRYYRKFGYELGGNDCQFWCRPHNLPAFNEHRWCRPATQNDIERLQVLYSESCRRRSCALVRTTQRWLSLIESLETDVIVYGRGQAAGFVILRDGLDQYGGRQLTVEELVVESAEARRGLIGHLARYSGEGIDWCASPTDLVESGVLRSVAPLREGFKPRGIATVRPMFQFRVVDTLAALKARAPSYAGLHGDLSVIVRDDLVASNQRPISISARDGTVQLVAGGRTEHWIEADIRPFSQIFCGYLSPAEAVSQGLAQVSDPEACSLAEDFFPRLDPFIPMMDRF